MDNKEILNTVYKDKMPEIIVDFSNSTNGKMLININFNRKMSEERKALEKNTIPLAKNIMILYIDSVSRANSIRKFKKTLNFIEKFMSYKGGYNQKYPEDNYHSFQFLKYHSFEHYTTGNFPIIFYGKRIEERRILITKYLKKKGYVTSYVSDLCLRDAIRPVYNITKEETYDHQFITCDPNASGANTNIIRCLYGKQIGEHLLEYGNLFWRQYKENRKFLAMILNDGHEGTLEVVKYLDDIIFNFLNSLFEDNLFKDSTIFFLSDHGTGMPSPYYYFRFYQIEIHLPMLYIIINDRKNSNYSQQYKNISENQQTLITPYDIYNTFINLIFGDKYSDRRTPKSNRGTSLFFLINKLRRPKQFFQMSQISCH
jgi:hypothetical protein